MADVISVYTNATNAWVTPLQQIAEQVFWTLAILEIAWSGVRMVLRGGDVADLIVELIQQIVFIGFFYLILSQFPTYAQDVIVGMQDAASSVSGVSLANPGNIFTIGLNIVSTVASSMSMFKPGADLVIGCTAIVMMAIFALIAANIIFVVIEAHFAVVAGILFLGLGSSRWTNSFAMKIILYVFSIAAKLFVMELVVGVGQTIITQFASQAPNATYATELALLGAVIIFFVLMKSIPEVVQGVINGTNFNTGGGLGTALGAMAAGGVAAGMSALGAGSAVKEAMDLAAATSGGGGGSAGGGQGGQPSGGDDGGGGDSGGEGGRLGRGQVMARAAGILGRAALADIRGRREGDPMSRYGTMGGRMARRIRSHNTSKSGVPPLTPDPS